MLLEKTYRKKYLPFFGEEGTTLVELMVAMVLLLAVALPSGMFLGYMAHYPRNGEKIVAFGIAQTALEEMLHNKTFIDKTEKKEEVRRGWTIKREQLVKRGWIYLRVTVYRKDEVMVSLNTVRLNDFEHE